MVPADDEEITVIRCFTLSLKSGFNSAEIEYQVVRDFSKKYKMDIIELFEITKRMCSIFNDKK